MREVRCEHPLCGVLHATDPASEFRLPGYAPSSCGKTSDQLRAIASAIVPGSVLVLGEVHDNPLHHAMHASMLWSRAVVMEQIRADQQAGLDAFNKELDVNEGRRGTLGDLKRFLEWDKSGWAKYDYDPLLAAAVQSRLPVYPGDATQETMRRLVKDGAPALPEDERKRLALDVPLGEKLDAASAAEIDEAHCGALAKEMLPGMAYAQRYRDAHLADATLKAAEANGSAVLITGNGHARSDRGVPWYLRQRAPDKRIVSVLLIEVEEGKTDPEAYVPRDPERRPAADYIIFTPPAKREGTCAQLLEKKQN